MKSRLNVEFDFDTNEPFIQLTVDDTNAPDERPDMRDTVLKNFVEKGSQLGIKVVWQEGFGNMYPQLRPGNSENDLNWVGCNATFNGLSKTTDVYQRGESYNIDVATGVNHSVRVRHHLSAVVKDYADDIVYDSFKQFANSWQIN